MDMIASELSEPYSIYTYRYFLEYWPNMCFLVKIKFFIKLKAYIKE